LNLILRISAPADLVDFHFYAVSEYYRDFLDYHWSMLYLVRL